MNRSFRTWTIAVIVGGSAVFATPTPALAQFYNIPLGGGYNLRYSRFQSFSVPIMGPNGPTTVGYFNAGFRPYRQTTIVTPYYGGSYLGGGFGAGAGLNPGLAQQRDDLARAQRRATAAANDGRRAIADQWAYERGAKPLARPNDLARAAELVDNNLLSADPEEIASGQALNGLLTGVQPLHEKPGKPVDSPLVAPDLATRIVFAGSPKAEALNFLRAGRLRIPVALRTRELVAWRSELEAAYNAVLVAASEGRPVPPAVISRLNTAIAQGRDHAGPIVRGLPFPQAAEVMRFFNQLSSSAEVLADPSAAGLYVGNWSVLGLTVGELTTHMLQHDLKFGPSDGEAYATLHRGMVSYYLGLAQARK